MYKNIHSHREESIQSVDGYNLRKKRAVCLEVAVQNTEVTISF